MEIEEAIELFAGYIAFCEEYHQEVDLRADKIALQTMEEKARKSQNPPLTLEELRRMDGEPVWIEDLWQDFYGWELSADAQDYCAERDTKKYGTLWLAYRRKPEED